MNIPSDEIYDDTHNDSTIFNCAPLGIIPMPGSLELSESISKHLYKRRIKRIDRNPLMSNSCYVQDNYVIPTTCTRFSSGEGKATINKTVRGYDLYVVCDITNRFVTYDLFGKTVPLGPDDYYQDIKRIILASSGKAKRINILMPFLYQARQDIRKSRESLDCAAALQELRKLDVGNIICFDPHEPRIENAIPIHGLEALHATYYLLKEFLLKYDDVKLNKTDGLLVVSPSEAGMKRAMYYASSLEIPLGTFFRKFDYSLSIDGRNPILGYTYLGDSVKDRDILLTNDMYLGGTTLIETAKKLKDMGAGRIFSMVTFLLTDGEGELLSRAYEENLFEQLFCTNLNYLPDHMRNQPWITVVDMTEYIALIIDSLNHNHSIENISDQSHQIKHLLTLERNFARFDTNSKD